MNITILAVGKIRGVGKEAQEGYLTRLGPYAKIKAVEVEAESFTNDKGSKIKAKEAEAKRILSSIKKLSGADVILLRESGESFSSIGFAAFVGKKNTHIIFVLAGALGFSEEVVKKYPQSLSLSLMTFPHEMARVVLLEQIYRAATILRGKSYHY